MHQPHLLEKMKGVGIVFLSLAVGMLIIGIHQAMVYGITESYWVFMFAVCFLLLYRYVKKPEEEVPDKETATSSQLNKKKESIAGEGKMARKMRRKKKKIN